MAPKRQLHAEAEPIARADDSASSSKISDHFFTPASSPRGYCSAISHATNSCAASDACSDLHADQPADSMERRSKESPPRSLAPQKQGSQVVYFQRHEVGIEDDSAFFVVRRLLGPSGDNLATISEASQGAKVWISGQCSCRQDGEPTERTGPLGISIRGTSQESMQRASALVQELLHATRARYNRLITGSTTGESGLRADTAVFACSFKVGIDDDSSFQVVKRLVGKNGKNVKRIEADAPGASVRVRGRRGANQSYDSEPLTVDVSAVDPESFETASASVMALLTRVHADFHEFCVVNGKEVPVLAIRSEEGLPQPGP